MQELMFPLAILAFLSAYGIYLSYQNITRLQQYEKQSEKAAKWSNTVAHRLHKTRTTQASGTITLILSLFTTLTILFTSASTSRLILAGLFNCTALIFAYMHMSAFWNNKNQIQVPFVEKFNEAIKGSEGVVRLLRPLSFGWFWAATLSLFHSRNALLLNAIYVLGVGSAWLVYFRPTAEVVNRPA